MNRDRLVSFARSLVVTLAVSAGAPSCAPYVPDVIVDDPSGEGEGEPAEGEGEGEGEGEPTVGAPRYRVGLDHAPLTPFVAERLRAFRAAHPEHRESAIAKVGDSLTVSTSFLRCFDGSNIDLDGRPLDDALFFDGFSRESESAVVGWSAFAPLDGSPAPLDVELDATSPAFATVMFGTNDIQRGSITAYADDMLDLVDALLSRGVIPILSTIPPRDDSATADAQVPRYNLVVRAIAEARVVPLFDLERRLRPLPGHGIGADDLHLEQDPRGACILDAAGLGHGYNVRNLLALEALDRIQRAVVDGDVAPDADEPARPGSGSPHDPFVVDALPFTASLDTTTSPHRTIDTYPACSGADESGAELFWRLSLAAPTRVHVLAFDRAAVDIDVHVLDASGACLDRDDTEVTLDLPAGEHTIVLDTYAGDAQAGEALLVVYAE